ncbi:MAG TPA: glycosyltransferase [Rhizomicrobium sp.]|jgi:glycosyltransferase involved in cell wall biosynthesis|nr:glycosyltransferase [Rhizomicrobium sp.]
MRVLQIIDSLAAGGKERQFIELLKGLKAKSDIICGAVVMSDVIAYPEFHRLDIETAIMPRRTRYDASLLFRLHTFMRHFQPSVVQSWNSMSTVYSAPLARLAGAKFIDAAVQAAEPNLSLKNRDYFRVKLFLPLAHAVIGNSKAGLAAYRIPDSKAVCIYNGFDPTRLQMVAPPDDVRQSLGITTPFVVGMVASFSARKDYVTFLEAAKIILAQRSDVTFIAVGSGELLEGLKAAYPCERFPLIKFLGGRTDVESIVNIFTIGVLTSNCDVHGEGIANALIECMAAGKPVIATNFGGTGELVEDGVTGYLIDDRDAPALGHRILHLLENPSVARALGERGRRRIEQHFSIQRLTEDHVSLYRDLMTRS